MERPSASDEPVGVAAIDAIRDAQLPEHDGLDEQHTQSSHDRYPNFIQSGIFQAGNNTNNTISLSDDPSFIDPLRPPVVKLTELSAAEGLDHSRYLLARLRDRNIYEKCRYFLSYFFDQPSNVCLKGMTRTSLLMFLKSEGLPTDCSQLRGLFFKYHIEYGGLTRENVESDLSALAKFLKSERINFLQSSESNMERFYYGKNFPHH